MQLKDFIATKSGKLSKIITDELGLNYSTVMKAFRSKDIKINGERVNKDQTVLVGARVEIYFNPQTAPFYSLIYSDQNLLVVYKKKGFTAEQTFENILAEYKTARFIHRLDRNTDGVMVFALNDMAEKELLEGFKSRAFEKYYHATVKGVPKIKEQILTAYLVKDSQNSQVKIYSTKQKNSVEIKTGYSVIKSNGETSQLLVKLFTGKTHQIRAHLAFIGHPIVGDGKYGDNAFNKKLGAKSQMLTAYKIVLKFKGESSLNYLNNKEFTVNQGN